MEKKKNCYQQQLSHPEREKAPASDKGVNPKKKICISDFHLEIKLENEAPKPISSDKDNIF